jgi:DNA-binding CsgD family transcriptional regulator
MWDDARRRIERICAAPGDDRALRAAVLEQIRRVVPFDAYVWIVTDPTTAVGASPLAEVPSLRDLPAVIRLKYLTPVNRWTVLPPDRVLTLAGADPDAAADWRGFLRGYGIHDVASAVLRDDHGCWGFLDLWRERPAFTPDEQAFLASVLPPMTRSLRASLAATFAVPVDPALADGPTVMLLDDTLEPGSRTPQADDALRALLPTPPGRSPVPAVVLNVAAQLLAGEAGVDAHPPTARLHRADGRWIEVQAARLLPIPSTGPTIAVSIQRATPARRAEVYCRAIGLSRRETQLVEHLVTGADTRSTARALDISEHTVNDHLKSIFAKAGVNSRPQLVTRARG